MSKKKKPSRRSPGATGPLKRGPKSGSLPPHSVPEEQQLAAALAAQDTAAVAFALRNDYVIVPLLPGSGPDQIRVFRPEGEEKYVLLLFSHPERYVEMVPQEPSHRFLAYDAASLRDFLEQNVANLQSVVFDVAGPHSMQAEPQDILDALQLEA